MNGRHALSTLFLLTGAIAMTGCLRLRTEHKVEPIEINLNVRIQMEREMADFIDSLDEEKEITPPPRPLNNAR